MVVAIDGPAGAGKSTVARAVAAQLGFTYLDTGALYRALTLAALERGVTVDDPVQVLRLLSNTTLSVAGDHVFVDGLEVSNRIRDPQVTQWVSTVAAHPRVRAAMVELQRSLARSGDVVVEGRDIGSTVFPDAAHKFFLTASLQERARRRALELGVGEDDVDRLESAIRRRDEADSKRDASPLARAEDAREIDSTGKSQAEVIAGIVAAVRGEA